MNRQEAQERQYLANLYIARFNKTQLIPGKSKPLYKPKLENYIAKMICNQAASNVPISNLYYHIDKLERVYGKYVSGKPYSLIRRDQDGKLK